MSGFKNRSKTCFYVYETALLSQGLKARAFATCVWAFAEGVVLCGAFACSFATSRVQLGKSIGIRNSTFGKAFATLVLIEAFAGFSQTFRDLRFAFCKSR